MRTFLAAAAILAASNAFAMADPAAPSRTTGVEQPSAAPQLNSVQVQGCFSSQGNMTSMGTIQYNSESSCALNTCAQKGYPVAGTMAGNQCFCGFQYPPLDTVVDDSNCDVGCSGFGPQACGGINFWTVYNTGLSLIMHFAPNVSTTTTMSATPTATTSQSSSVTTQTNAATTSSSSGGGKGSTNTAGIAAGVVVAVVVVAAIVGGLFFFIRRRRNEEIEEEHRRNAAVNAFIHGHKGTASTSGGSITDVRLDPVMAQRRMSDGSIADNEDYSRRILRVTNA